MMLLRSSSTPILPSMLEARGSSQNPSKTSRNHRKILFPTDVSPRTWRLKQARRVNSDGNLKATLSTEKTTAEDSPVKCKSMRKLERFLSFSLYVRNVVEGEDNEEVESTDGYNTKEDEFSFPGDHASTRENNGGFGLFNLTSHVRSNSCPLPASIFGHNFLQEPTTFYMAIGLGMGPPVKETKFDDDQMQQQYFEKSVKENPCNPRILGNYARYLYKTKRDNMKAEEFYSRAILAEPNDGEVLSEYAKLRLEVHGDEETASNYFERAIQASPMNSDVLAAYAYFLWDTEEKEMTQDTTETITVML